VVAVAAAVVACVVVAAAALVVGLLWLRPPVSPGWLA
jgi:hypothetical protein